MPPIFVRFSSASTRSDLSAHQRTGVFKPNVARMARMPIMSPTAITHDGPNCRICFRKPNTASHF